MEPDGEPRVLAEGIDEDPVLGADGRGRVWAACRDRSGRVLAGPIAAGPMRRVDGEVEELLGIGGSATTGPVLAAYDREGRVLARALESGEGRVELGTLQGVVEPDSLEPPVPEAGAAALQGASSRRRIGRVGERRATSLKPASRNGRRRPRKPVARVPGGGSAG